MTPAEQSERDQMAYVLDALLAITAVALNAEQIAAAAEYLQELKWRQAPGESVAGARWATVNKASEARRRVA